MCSQRHVVGLLPPLYSWCEWCSSELEASIQEEAVSQKNYRVWNKRLEGKNTNRDYAEEIMLLDKEVRWQKTSQH